MSGRYQEGYVAGHKKGMKDGAAEIERLRLLASDLANELEWHMKAEGFAKPEVLRRAPPRAGGEMSDELFKHERRGGQHVAHRRSDEIHELRAEIERLRAADIQLRNRIRKFALLWHVPQEDVDAALEGG